MFNEQRAKEILTGIRRPLLMRVDRNGWYRVGAIRMAGTEVEILDWDRYSWEDPWDRSPIEEAVTYFGVHAAGGGVLLIATAKRRVRWPRRGRRVPYGPGGLRSTWREPR